MNQLIMDPINFEAFFPDKKALSTLSKKFRVNDAILNIKKNYCIGYIKTEIYLNSHSTFLIGINEKEFFGFYSLAYPEQFKYYPFKSSKKEEFISLIERKISPVTISHQEIIKIISHIQDRYPIIIEKEFLEATIENQKTALKIKL